MAGHSALLLVHVPGVTKHNRPVLGSTPEQVAPHRVVTAGPVAAERAPSESPAQQSPPRELAASLNCPPFHVENR
jgi:hypothetical protein